MKCRPVTGRLMVVRIGDDSGGGVFWEVRILGRESVRDLTCGTLAGLGLCSHTAILISDL